MSKNTARLEQVEKGFETSSQTVSFISTLMPYVMKFSYIWFNLQAFERKLEISEELKLIERLKQVNDSVQEKWTKQLLAKLRKDIKDVSRKHLIGCISDENYPNVCVMSNPDQKGKMRRIDCLRQADKVWRLDLVMAILFKSFPLESTDGERLTRLPICNQTLCINPKHMSLVIREIDLLASALLTDEGLTERKGMTYIVGPFSSKELLNYAKQPIVKTGKGGNDNSQNEIVDLKPSVIYCSTKGPLFFEKSSLVTKRSSTSLDNIKAGTFASTGYKHYQNENSDYNQRNKRPRYYSEMTSEDRYSEDTPYSNNFVYNSQHASKMNYYTPGYSCTNSSNSVKQNFPTLDQYNLNNFDQKVFNVQNNVNNQQYFKKSVPMTTSQPQYSTICENIPGVSNDKTFIPVAAVQLSSMSLGNFINTPSQANVNMTNNAQDDCYYTSIDVPESIQNNYEKRQKTTKRSFTNYIVPEQNDGDSMSNATSGKSSDLVGKVLSDNEDPDETSNNSNITAVAAILNERMIPIMQPLLPDSTFIGFPMFSPAGSPCGLFSPINNSLFPSPILTPISTPRGTPIPMFNNSAEENDDISDDRQLYLKSVKNKCLQEKGKKETRDDTRSSFDE